MTSAVKSFLVLLLVLPLLVIVGNEIGSDDYFFPFLVVALTLGAIVVALFFRSQRLECLVLLFLIGGYFVGCRGFAQLAITQPLFVGELGLAAVLVIMLIRYATAREFFVPRHPLGVLIGAYLMFALIRFVSDYGTYGIDAARDSAIVYYALFFFIAYQIGLRQEVAPFFNRAMVWVFILQAIVAAVFIISPETIELVQIRGVSPISQKSDLTATFSAVGLIFLALHPGIVVPKWLRAGFVLLLTADMVLPGARAAVVSVFAALPFIWLARRRGFLLIPCLVAGFGILGVFAAGSLLPERVISVRDQVVSTIDVSGTQHYNTDFGEEKQADNRFREVLWRSIYDQTTQDNWLLGKGFGYNFIPIFEREYGAGRWEGLRSAHNYFVTVFGRLGLVGFLIFVGIVIEAIRQATRSALALRRGETHDISALSYWCCALIMATSGTFGVVMEGPMGAIPFWSFLGMALATDDRRILAAKKNEAVVPLVLQVRESRPATRRPSMAR